MLQLAHARSSVIVHAALKGREKVLPASHWPASAAALIALAQPASRRTRLSNSFDCKTAKPAAAPGQSALCRRPEQEVAYPNTPSSTSTLRAPKKAADTSSLHWQELAVPL